MSTSTHKIERDVKTYSYILDNMVVPQIAYTNNNPGTPDLAPGTAITLENTTFHALAVQYDIDQSTKVATPANNTFGRIELYNRSYYNAASLPTLSADGDLVFKKYLEDNYRKSSGNVIVVDSAGSGNYTTIQAALDAHTDGGELFLVHPGTYTDTINFTANDQIVTGYDSNPNACIVQQASTNILDGDEFTGCFVANITLNMTAATSAVSVISSNGSLSMYRCNINTTTAYSTAGLQPSNVEGGGNLTFDFCNFTLTHTGSIGADIKYHGFYTAGATLIYRHCNITMNCSGTALITTSGFGTSSDVLIIFDDNKLIITDLDADTVAAAIFGGTEDVSFSRNVMEITCGEGNTAICGWVTGTPTLRAFNNHMHAVYTTSGTAVAYDIAVGATVCSVGEEIIATEGIINLGTLYISSIINNTFVADSIDVTDTGFKLQASGDETKELTFDCSNISTSTVRTLTALNTNGSIATEVAIPASSGATGIAGSIAYQSGFLYVCVADDTWERTSIATW